MEVQIFVAGGRGCIAPVLQPQGLRLDEVERGVVRRETPARERGVDVREGRFPVARFDGERGESGFGEAPIGASRLRELDNRLVNPVRFLGESHAKKKKGENGKRPAVGFVDHCWHALSPQPPSIRPR